MGNLCTIVNVLLLLLPSSTMGSEDESQRTELTREEWERRATIPLLRRLVSKQHHQQQQRSQADAQARRLRQEVDELDVYNMDRLHVELEAMDLRMDISPHLRMSSSPLLPKTAPPAGPPPVRVLLKARPQPV
jgi:TPP-dependent pyruvate/acetoin dehydrogenase alpha subunit